MKLFKTVYLVLSLCAALNSMWAQQQPLTPYEKRMIEIIEKYASICKYGYENALTWKERSEIRMYLTDEEAREFILGVVLFQCATTYSQEEIKRLAKQIKRDIEAAKKLKTAEDYRRERERKKLKLQKEFEKSDKGIIFKNIKEEFQYWQQKGEFETQTEHEKRLQERSKSVFDTICVEQIQTQIKKIIEYYVRLEPNDYSERDPHREIWITLHPYNVEKQAFTLAFKIDGIEENSSAKEFFAKIKLPREEAQKLKESWYKQQSKWSAGEAFKWSLYDWQFIDNYLCPKYIVFVDQENKKEYTFKVNNKNAEEITIPFDKLAIQNKYLTGYVFDYSIIAKVEKENERKRKEMERKKFVMDSLKYESLIKQYNEELLLFPYNIHKETLKIEPLKDNKHFDYQIEKLKEEFEEKKENIMNSLRNEDFEKYVEIYYVTNPEIKKEADAKFLECRCVLTRKKFDKLFFEKALDWYKYECNCREKKYNQAGYLFKDKNEFNTFYDKGEKIIDEEIQKRKAVKFITDNKNTIKSITIRKKKPKNEKAVNYLKKEYRNDPVVDYLIDSEAAKVKKKLIQIIEENKNQKYYPEIVELLMQTNQKLNKEWVRNGKYFKNKIDFFNAYIEVNYKQKLKQLK